MWNLDIDKKDFLGDLDIIKMADGDKLQSHRKFKQGENTFQRVSMPAMQNNKYSNSPVLVLKQAWGHDNIRNVWSSGLNVGLDKGFLLLTNPTFEPLDPAWQIDYTKSQCYTH